MKISTWNVNSIRARIENFLSWIKQEQPDIVLLQELKCLNEAFPYELIEDLNYNIAIAGQKTYNGVGIISKFPLSEVNTILPENPISDEARFIEAVITKDSDALRLVSVYVPNGNEINSTKYINKLNFMEALTGYFKNMKEEKIIIGGDFNVALNEEDIFDANKFNEQILFSLKERQALRRFIANGFVDCYRFLNNDPGFTWWDYRANSFRQDHGARIDYLFANAEAISNVSQCFVDKNARAEEKASDHAPLTIIYK